MSRRAILAIDPGSVSGAYAFVDAAGNVTVDDLPTVGDGVNARELFDFVKALRPDYAVVESVGSMPGQGVVSVWKFAKSVGVIHAVLACAGVRMELVTPQKWKGFHHLAGKAADKAVKEKTRALASRLYPTVKGLSRAKDHNRADALLLLDYVLKMRTENNGAET